MKTEKNSLILEAQQVSFAYAKNEVPLLADLSFSLKRAEIFCVLGPTGTGKTTLLKILAGLLSPTAGQIFFGAPVREEGNLSKKKEEALAVGMSFQRGGLLDWLTVEENVDFALEEVTQLNSAERKDLIKHMLNRVGLGSSLDLQVRELSGGMQKRLSIARAMALKPQVLLLDEPTAGLDPITAAEIIAFIKEHYETYQNSIVLVTSDLSVAFALAQKIGFLWRGKFLLVETQAEFKKSSYPEIQQYLHGYLEGPLTEIHRA